MKLTKDECDCCEAEMYVIDDLEDVLEYDKPSNSFYLVLDEEELRDLYFQLKEVVCQ